MNSPISTYSFLPWLRQGLANRITAPDLDESVKLRAEIDVDVELEGDHVDGRTLKETIHRKVQLYGPGDIVGIKSQAIVKAEPGNWITNFEPNYLPHIEFYDEDFPWRYTPAAPDEARHKLRPWIALVVFKEEVEFEDRSDLEERPLPFIEIPNSASVLPPAEQLWAWAHVHVNEDLAASEDQLVSNDMAAVLPKFAALLDQDPDLASSRILCPRRLEPNAAYHAFLIPVFESGRLAGLGLDPSLSPHATFSAWADYSAGAAKEEPTHFPYYHRWYFRTGTVGDFEYLVRLLEPKPVNSRVGRRDMDLQDPGSGLRGITGEALGGVLKLGGALKVPRDSLNKEELEEYLKYEEWDKQDYPHPFQKDLAAFVNLADDYATRRAQEAHNATDLDEAIQNDEDPLITAPLYGRWHALTRRLLKDRDGGDLVPNDNWVHQLNLDPRHRVTAGFGTRVVQKNQETYMAAAWKQVGEILEANRRIKQAQLAKEVSKTWYTRSFLPTHGLNPERAFVLTAPLHKRVLAEGLTVFHQTRTSVVPVATTSVSVRRAMRPRGRLFRGLQFDDRIQPGNLIDRVNAGEVAAAPPKTSPDGATTLDDLAEALLPDAVPPALVRWLRRFPWLRFVPLALAALVAILLALLNLSGLWLAIGAAVIAGLLFLYRLLARWVGRIKDADSILEENQTPEAVDQLPNSPDFVLTKPEEGFTPTTGNSDSPEAARFKAAMRDANRLLVGSREAGAVPEKEKLDLPGMAEAMIQGIDPKRTIPRHVFQGIHLPGRFAADLEGRIREAMAYPEIDAPMYKPLADISADLFLPNINYVSQNSISLLETNQPFIEAYMVGLNHEFARELLWREYPTDQRGSYFRQFWDVSSYLASSTADPEELRKALKDIPPLHEWSGPPRYSPSSELGAHDHRERGGEQEDETVLVIRGELLKRYPTAVIYAHRAEWPRKDDGTIDQTRERQLVGLSPSEEADPPDSKVKTPLYNAKVDPEIYFFGFDLTIPEARGGTGENEADDPGWFFVIKERPGEPRFGLDIERDGELNVWNDLAWPDVLQGNRPGDYIPMGNASPSLTLIRPTDPEVADEKEDQFEDDQAIQWNSSASAADLAYMLYQAPVMVAVHAAEMLPKN